MNEILCYIHCRNCVGYSADKCHSWRVNAPPLQMKKKSKRWQPVMQKLQCERIAMDISLYRFVIILSANCQRLWRKWDRRFSPSPNLFMNEWMNGTSFSIDTTQESTTNCLHHYTNRF